MEKISLTERSFLKDHNSSRTSFSQSNVWILLLKNITTLSLQQRNYMNFITRTLLPLVLLSSSIGPSIHAMDQQITSCKNMSNKDLISSIKELPQDVTKYIVYLLIQSSLVHTFKLSKVINVGGGVSSLAFSPDGGNFLVGYCTKQTADLLNLQTEKILRTFLGHTTPITSVAFSPDGRKCLTASFDHSACVWDSNTEELITRFTGHRERITSATFSPGGETCLTGSWDSTACVWNSTTGELVAKFSEHSDRVTSVAFSPDGENCLTGSWDKTACIWNAKTAELVLTFCMHTFFPPVCVAFNPHEETCLIGLLNNVPCVKNSKTGTLVLTLKGRIDKANTATFSPDGKLILTADINHTAFVCNSKTGEQVAALTGHRGSISSLAFSPKGETILTGSDDTTVRVWKAIYDFSCLTPEKKERAYKLFLTLYPLLKKPQDTTTN